MLGLVFTFIILISTIAVLGSVFGLGIMYQRRSALAQGAAAVASLGPIASAIQKAEEELVHQRAETERARADRDEKVRTLTAERDAEARKAREYFDRIEGIVKEATECRRLLVRTGAEHAAAQAMMLREIESLAIQYRTLTKQYRDATKKAPPRPEPLLNTTLQVIADEFREAHVAPYQNQPAPAPVQSNPLPGG
jgi:hypothetical protein